MKLFLVVMSVTTVVAKFTVVTRLDALPTNFPAAAAALVEEPVRATT